MLIAAVAIAGCASAPEPTTAPASAPKPTTTVTPDTGEVAREQRWRRPVEVKPPATALDTQQEEALRPRVIGRQTAMREGRWEDAWRYLSAGSRLLTTPEQIQLNYQRDTNALKSVGTIECRGGTCTAAVLMSLKLPVPRVGAHGTAFVFFERWVYSDDGVAYLVLPEVTKR